MSFSDHITNKVENPPAFAVAHLLFVIDFDTVQRLTYTHKEQQKGKDDKVQSWEISTKKWSYKALLLTTGLFLMRNFSPYFSRMDVAKKEHP